MRHLIPIAAAALALGGCSLFSDAPRDIVLVTPEPVDLPPPAECNPKADPKWTVLPKRGDVTLGTVAEMDAKNARAFDRIERSRSGCWDGLKARKG